MANNSLVTNPNIVKNKYFNIYVSIVTNALKRIELVDYHEKHHILPKCMNGSDKKENIVRLTAREHFICHALLSRFVVGEYKYKMLAAIILMANKSKNHGGSYVNSRLYEAAKKNLSIVQSKRMMGVKRGPMSEEHKMKIRLSKIGKKRPDMMGDKNFAKRDDVRKKISENQTGLVRGKCWNKNIKMSAEHKKTLSSAKSGKQIFHHPVTRDVKYISQNEINNYVELGWIKGRINKNG